MTIPTNPSQKTRRNIWTTFLLLTLTVAVTSSSAQSILLPSRSQTRGQAIGQITSQGYNVIFNSRDLDESSTVQFGRTELPLRIALDKLTQGTGLAYSLDGRHIILYRSGAKETTSVVNVTSVRTLTGTVANQQGEPLEGVSVELVGARDTRAATFSNGRFGIEGVASGNHVVKLTSADGQTIRYREVNVPAAGDADVTLTLSDEILVPTPSTRQAQTSDAAVQSDRKVTAYYVPTATTDNTIRAFSDAPKTEMFFVSASQVKKNYIPAAAVKTNLLWFAAASPNVALELGLAPKWTLDLSAVYNPFQLRKGGVNRFGIVQPEARYWFCQRFEKHFVGLHGIYGRFNIGQVDFLTRTFIDHRYNGWGAGGGVSYGYHLPVGRRWAMEFTVGAGYVYLRYDKFRCYECDEYLETKKRQYLGPTKAGISLIYMIK